MTEPTPTTSCPDLIRASMPERISLNGVVGAEGAGNGVDGRDRPGHDGGGCGTSGA